MVPLRWSKRVFERSFPRKTHRWHRWEFFKETVMPIEWGPLWMGRGVEGKGWGLFWTVAAGRGLFQAVWAVPETCLKLVYSGV